MPPTPENGSSLVGFEQVSSGRHPIHRKSLTEIANANNGAVSDLIDAEYEPLLSKMLMMQGFDYTGLGYYHHSGMFGNWHQTADKSEGNPDMATLDVVLAEYYASIGLPGDMVAYSASWQDSTWGCSYRADGELTTSRFYNPATLWDKYFANATIPTNFKELLVDRVMQDYKALQNNPRLGTEDRHRLEAHIAHLAETEAKIKKFSAVCNQMRPDENLTERDEILLIMNNVIVGLIACGMCHSYMGWAQALIDENPDNWHVWSHQGYDNDSNTIANPTDYAKVVEQSRQVLKIQCLDLAKKLEDLDLLDDCLIVCIQEHNKRGHESWNVPAIAFGSAGGVLKTNQYVDFRNIGDRDDFEFSRFGFPMNQLYATILRAMGMPAAEFEALNKQRANGSRPFKANSGYGIDSIHPDAEFNMGSHYESWTGHDMSAFLPQVTV
jgi:hypothetical protein